MELTREISQMEQAEELKLKNIIKHSERIPIEKMKKELGFGESIKNYDLAIEYPLMNSFGFIKPKFDLKIDQTKLEKILFKMIYEELKIENNII